MITVNQKELLTAIKAVKPSCGKGNINPILNTIKIKSVNGGIELTATDLTNSASAVVEANVTDPILFCVNADKLENIVSVLEDNVTIENEEPNIFFKSGRTKFKVLALNATEYPNVEFEMSEDKVVLPREEFIKGVNQTVIATTDISQYLLSCICFTFKPDNYELAATDGNRLSVVNFKHNGSKQGRYVIPHSILTNVARVIADEVEISFTDKKVIFRTGNFIYSSVLFNGTYPQYRQLMPKEQPLNAVIKKDSLLKALERVAIMSNDSTNITVFDFKNNELHLTTSCDDGKAEDIVEVAFSGEIKTAFNFKYILEGIRAMQTDTIRVSMNTPLSATIWQGDYTYLCMPIQLKKEQ